MENVQITPQMFRSWLMYVTPLLADATDCQGRASVTLERAIFPLASPASGQVAGTLTLHGADVRPGPLANQYVGLAQQIRALFQQNQQASAAPNNQLTLVHLDEQELRVEMINGRIHHHGLKMKIGDVTATTSGSVGVDQTLDLVIAVPIQDDWLKGGKVIGSLAGQTVQIPIKGTIGRPAIDRTALEGVSRQMLTGAASNLLNREVKNLFDGLLRPPAAQGAPPQTTGPQATGAESRWRKCNSYGPIDASFAAYARCRSARKSAFRPRRQSGGRRWHSSAFVAAATFVGHEHFQPCAAR